jgi:head-tail adaptor
MAAGGAVNQLGIVHPGLLVHLEPNHYAGTVTIQTATVANDSAGQEIPTWANLANHVDLPARKAARQQFSREVRNQSQLYAVHVWDITIAGYYTGITEEMRAVMDGVAYDIELVQFDGNRKMTHLQVRKVD